MNIYQEILMDHYHRPRNYGTLENPTIVIEEHNPSCGDSISFHCFIKDNGIKELKFIAQGCVISIATASLLSERMLNKDIETVLSFSPQNLQELIGITLGPLRIKCALLSLNALQKGITDYQKKQ